VLKAAPNRRAKIGKEEEMPVGKAIAPVVSALAVISWSTSVGATLIFEPVISHYRGSGPDDMVFPLYDPTYINTATGEQVSLARKPGEIDSWSQGYPPEEVMMTFGMYNNTPYNITSLTMTIIGDSAQTPDETGWVVDPNHISARFGDVNGDGKIGLSDIFGTITASADFRTLTLSNGVIPAEGHFTDYIFSAIIGDDDLRTEAFAGLEGTFDGVFAPEPSTWALLIPGVGAMIWAGIRRRAPRARH
jgi:hypothetical protein